MANYLTGAELKEALHLSKLTYCSYTDDADTRPSIYTYDLAEVDAEEGTLVRLMTYEHIPRDPAKFKLNVISKDHHPVLMFPAFKHFRRQNGAWIEVLRSHWKGPIEGGEFCNDHGRIGGDLAMLFMKLIERRASSSNWCGYSYRDEMQAEAITNLMHRGLCFNEAKSNNPFAYYTCAIDNSFKKILRLEKRQQSIRDDLLEEEGLEPSHTRVSEWHDSA